MGNVLSKIKVSMKSALHRVKTRLNRDERAMQIYQQIHQEDHNIEIEQTNIVYL